MAQNTQSWVEEVACPNPETKIANVDCQGKMGDNGECEDYWKKQNIQLLNKGIMRVSHALIMKVMLKHYVLVFIRRKMC